MQIAWIMGVPIAIYAADWVIGAFCRTYLIETPTFTQLECGVELQFDHPPGFSSDGTGYLMVCVPWISRYEWHAPSLPTTPSPTDCAYA